MIKFLISILAISFSLCAQDTLPFYKETKHFQLYCLEKDQGASDEILAVLENSYAQICKDFQSEPEGCIPIEIYPSVQDFHKKIGLPISDDWFVAFANEKDLPHLKAGMFMVSLNNPGSYHNQKSMCIVAVHELTHFFIFKKAESGLPLWMHEGLASFEAGMFDSKSINHMAYLSETQGIPSLSKLSEFDSKVFCALGGYSFSYTLVEFIVEKWDFETLLSLVQRFDRFEEILGTTKDTFESDWKEFVTQRYLINHQWDSSSAEAQR